MLQMRKALNWGRTTKVKLKGRKVEKDTNTFIHGEPSEPGKIHKRFLEPASKSSNGFGATRSPRVVSTEELLIRAITKGTQSSAAPTTVSLQPASKKPSEKTLPKKRKISLELNEDLFNTEGKPIVSGETLDAFKLPQSGGYYDRMSLLQCSTEAACHAYNVLQGSLSIRASASKVTAEAMLLRKENDALKMKLKYVENLHNRTVKELKAMEKSIEEKILDQATFYTLRARVELMEQFQ